MQGALDARLVYHVRQKAPETPDALALGPYIATISWGENGIIVGTPMVGI
jgi:hypothetical protein